MLIPPVGLFWFVIREMYRGGTVRISSEYSTSTVLFFLQDLEEQKRVQYSYEHEQHG